MIGSGSIRGAFSLYHMICCTLSRRFLRNRVGAGGWVGERIFEGERRWGDGWMEGGRGFVR